MTVTLSESEILLQAARKARSAHGRLMVVKLGGSALEDPVSAQGTLESVATLNLLGLPVILVHGGGKPIDRAMAAAGLTPTKVLGRRYTDDATLEIVVQVLGEINAGLVEQLSQFGVNAIGYRELAQFPLSGEKLYLPGPDNQPVDLGHVGKVTEVDADALAASRQHPPMVPVLPSLARGTDGWLNVNADTVAAGIVGAMHADACLFLTDTPGVLWDINEPRSLLPRLTRAECQRLISDGVIGGGMIPKVEACFEALDAGASRAVILDGRNPHALLAEFVTDRPAGTEIVP